MIKIHHGGFPERKRNQGDTRDLRAQDRGEQAAAPVTDQRTKEREHPDSAPEEVPLPLNPLLGHRFSDIRVQPPSGGVHPGREGTLLQTDSVQLRRTLGGPTPPLAERSVAQAAAAQGTQGESEPLPYLSRIQQAFGDYDIRSIGAHRGPRATAAARSLGAAAFATGNQVVFAGTPDLRTAAHEAAHVVQQRAGVHLSGGVGQAGDRHEQHAEAVADAVLNQRSAQGLLDLYAGGQHDGSTAHSGLAGQVGESEGSVVQGYGGKLLQQSGPSCWLFVSEAIADLKGQNTWLLAGLIYLYPQEPAVRTRKDCVALIQDGLLSAAEKIKKAGSQGKEEPIKKARISELLRRSFDDNNDSDKCVNHLFPEEGSYDVAQVCQILKHAATLAESLVGALTESDDTESILGGAPTLIAEDSEDTDITLTLTNLSNSFLSVSARYRPNKHQACYDATTDTYDLTTLPLNSIDANAGPHALLLRCVNSRSLVYKDPNFGDSQIVITFNQLRRMAALNKGIIKVRGMYENSSLLKVLKESKTPAPPKPR